MSGAPPRTLLWGVCAGLLLLLGFAVMLAVAGRLAEGDPRSVERARQGLAVYGAVVLLKGLLPQLLLSLGFYRLAAGRLDLERTRLRMILGVAGCALLAGLLVASLLMTLPLPGFNAAVTYRGPGNFVATWLQLSTGMILALGLPRLVLPPLR